MEAVLARFQLQKDATTGDGAVADLKGMSRHISAYIDGGAGVGAGAIQLETAADPAYAGTWAAIGSPVTVAASVSKLVQAVGTFGAIRARVSTTVTGGTVSVKLFAN